MLSNARLLERRMFEAYFCGAPARLVSAVIRAYQNSDGGFGSALEPDLRCPTSQPLFVEFGLSALYEVGVKDPELGLSVCAYLETVANEQGLLPAFIKDACTYPHAPHWDVPVTYGLNPTLGICGLLHYHGVKHKWLTQATKTSCSMLLANPPAEAHTLLGACRLIDHLPDQQMASRLRTLVAEVLPTARFFLPTAPVDTYGLTPLHFAPTPASSWCSMFSQEQIAGHLDQLLQRQQDDSGWPISWSAPSKAAELEWRGHITLQAVAVLTAYGVLEEA